MGTPQGSVPSTTLFNIAIKDVVSNIQPPVKPLLDSDDLTLYIKGKNFISMTHLMQSAICTVKNWFTAFTFSSEKRRGILFSKIRPPPVLVLKLCNQNIAFQATIKYLGIIFDQKLTWKDHTRSIIQECYKTLALLKILVHH